MRKRPDELFGFSIKEIAEICHVSEKTARRWKDGQIVPPHAVLLVLRGSLGAFHADWHGWIINPRDGDLVSPEGWRIRMTDVLASRLHQAQLSAWRHEVGKLKGQLEEALKGGYDDQPTPDELGEVVIKVG
jgi:hypothetical protein